MGKVEPASSVITTVDSEYLLGICMLEERLIILLDLQQALSSMDERNVVKRFEAGEDEDKTTRLIKAAA